MRLRRRPSFFLQANLQHVAESFPQAKMSQSMFDEEGELINFEMEVVDPEEVIGEPSNDNAGPPSGGEESTESSSEDDSEVDEAPSRETVNPSCHSPTEASPRGSKVETSRGKRKYDLISVSNEAEDNAWSLPEELAELFNRNATNFVSKKLLKKDILDNNPVPSNLVKRRKLDSHMEALIKGNDKPNVDSNKVISRDGELGDIWEAIVTCMGPLSKCWQSIEDFRYENPDSGTDEIALQLQQTVVLIGQAANKVDFSRRVAALASVPQVADYKTAENHVKNNAEAFRCEKVKLFGAKFSDAIKIDVKQGQKVATALETEKRAKNKSKNKRRPFREARTFKAPEGKRWHNLGARADGQRPRSSQQHAGRGQVISKTNGWRNFSRGKSLSYSLSQKLAGNRSPGPRDDNQSVPKNKLPKLPTRGKNPVLLQKLEDPYRRSPDLGGCPRVVNSTNSKTSSEKDSKGDPFLKTRISSHRCRGSGNAPERSHSGVKMGKRPNHKQHLCKTQKRGQVSSNNQLERTEQKHSVRTLQDGRLERYKTPPQEGRLYGEIGPLQCLLECPNRSKLPKILEVPVERETLQVPGLGLRSWTGATTIYQAAESPNIFPQTARDKTNHLFRRYSDYWELNERNIKSKGQCHYPFAPPGTDNQLGKILFDSIAQLRISWDDHQEPRNDHITSNRQSQGANPTLPVIITTETNDPKRSSQGDRQTLCHNTSSLNSSNSAPSSPTVPHKSPESRQELRGHSPPRSKCLSRSQMVDKESKTPERESSSVRSTRNAPLIGRFIRSRVGSSHGGWQFYRRKLVPSRTGSPHKHFGAHGCRNSSKNLLENKESAISSHPNRQQDSSILPSEERRDKKRDSKQNLQEDLGVSGSSEGKSDSQLDSFSSKQRSRQEIKGETQLQRMASKSRHIQENKSNLGNPRGGLLRVKNHEANRKVHESIPGSIMHSNKRHVSGLEPRISIPISSVLHDRQSAEKTENTKRTKGYSDSPNLARSSVVPNASRAMHRYPSTAAKQKKPVDKRPRRVTLDDKQLQSESGGIPSYRKTLESKGFSERAIHLLVNSKRKSTTEAYASPWNRWSAWCRERRLDPHGAPIEAVWST